jgi:glycosyltransferase involved in cell wall biosynthesis
MSNILITAPSLNENENVTGISTIVRTIINNNKSSNRFIHFRVGKKDNESKEIRWVWRQVVLVPQLLYTILKKKIHVLYLNTDLTRPSIIRDFFLLVAARYGLRKKVVLHIHGGHFLMMPPAKGSLFLWMIKSMFKNADLCIVLSEIEKVSIETNYGRICVVLPNAIEVREINEDEKDFHGKMRIIFLGRIVTSKGIHVIADAMRNLEAEFSQFDFHIYGTGPELDTFLEKLKTVDRLNYQYNGIVKGSQKWKALEQSHIFLLPSLFGEGLPIAMLEAMGRGCVPVVSDDASICTVVKDSVNGSVVTKGDTEGLAGTIRRLLQNRTQLKQMSIVAKSTIKERYDIDKYLIHLNKYCNSL